MPSVLNQDNIEALKQEQQIKQLLLEEVDKFINARHYQRVLTEQRTGLPPKTVLPGNREGVGYGR